MTRSGVRATCTATLARRASIALAIRHRLIVQGRRLRRGLTHLAITDHDRIDVALEARDAAPAGLTVIVGEEVKTADGDLICALPRAAIPPGLTAAETIAAAREQGGLVGHPAPVRPHARVAAARRGDGDARRRTSTGSRRTTRASSARATRRPPSSRSSTACPASRSRMPTRSWRSASPTRRSMATRRRRPGCSPLCRPLEIVPGRATLLRPRSGRPSPRASTRVRGNGRVDRRRGAVEPTRSRARRPGPSSDGGRRPTPVSVRRDGGRPRPSTRPTRPTTGRSSRRSTDEPTEVPPTRCRSAQRLRQPRTIISIVVPLGDHRFFLCLNRERLAEVPDLILQAEPGRSSCSRSSSSISGSRCAAIAGSCSCASTGFVIGPRDSTEILYLSWLVNCVVPAKLGDVYRAYLLKMNSAASLSRTFGTVFIERILDIFAIAMLGLAAGFWSFRERAAAGDPGRLRRSASWSWSSSWPSGSSRCATSAGGSSSGLPLPPRDPRAVRAVRGGRLRRRRPRASCRSSAVLTGLIWLTEGLRLYFVVLALGFADVELGLSGAIFVALIGSLLTAVPLSPAGLGFVEAGVIGVLTVAYGVPLPEATAITLLDWVDQRAVDHRLRRDRCTSSRRCRAGMGHDPAAAGRDRRPDRRLTARPVRCRRVRTNAPGRHPRPPERTYLRHG